MTSMPARKNSLMGNDLSPDNHMLVSRIDNQCNLAIHLNIITLCCYLTLTRFHIYSLFFCFVDIHKKSEVRVMPNQK